LLPNLSTNQSPLAVSVETSQTNNKNNQQLPFQSSAFNAQQPETKIQNELVFVKHVRVGGAAYLAGRF
jgi:hypothetical protein